MNRRDAIKALMVALPATATLSAARVQPDDVIVVEWDEPFSDKQAARIAADLQSVWPGRKIICMGDGLRMKIIKPAEAP